MRADEVIEVSAVAMIDVGGGALANVEIIAVVTVAIGFNFVCEVTYAVDVCAGAIIGVVPGSGVEVNAIFLAAVRTAWEFAVPAPFIEPFRSC